MAGYAEDSASVRPAHALPRACRAGVCLEGGRGAGWSPMWTG